MQEQLEALEAQLQEKEQLVTALTERLEQAAEQLDRLHRTGADRGLRVAGGIPQELVDDQKKLVEDLQRAVMQWEEMQVAATLGRVEIQVSELRDLFTGQVAGEGFAPVSAPQGGRNGRNANAAASQDAADAPSRGHDSPVSAYEAMKASLMASEPDSQTESPAAGGEDVSAGVAHAAEEIEAVDPPDPIDVDAASQDELQQAILCRDSYIQYLIRRLRVAETARRLPTDWEALNSVPEELQTRLEELEQKLQEALRLAEVEQSLERARLGREEARLRQLDHQVKKEIERGGLRRSEADDDEEEDDDHAENEGQGSSGRWMRMLGMGKGKDSGS